MSYKPRYGKNLAPLEHAILKHDVRPAMDLVAQLLRNDNPNLDIFQMQLDVIIQTVILRN